MHFAALLALTFLTSAAGLVVEIVAGRMMAPFFGMSLQTWTVVISVVLLGFSLGHAFGGSVADMEKGRAWRVTGWTLLAAAVTTLGAETVVAGLGAAAGDPMSLAWMSAAAGAAFFLPSFFVSYPTPFITKSAVEGGQGVSGRALGVVYGASSMGAIAGSVSAGFFFVPAIGSSATMHAMAGLYLAMAAYAFVRGSSLAKASAPLAAAGAAVLIAGTGGSGALARLCDVESPYYCIRKAGRVTDEGTESLLVLNQIVHAAVDPSRPDRRPLAYVGQVEASIAERLRSRDGAGRVFFIGGGGYTLPEAVVKAFPEADVTVAEIDEGVTGFVRDRFPEISLEGMRIVHADGRIALGAAQDGSLDVIVLDAFSDVTVPEHLVTAEFMDLAARKLTPDGLMIANVIDADRGPEFLSSLVRTASGALPRMTLFREKDDADGNGLSNYVVALSAQDTGLAAADPRMEPLPANLVLDPSPVQTDDRSNANFLVKRAGR